MNKLMNKIKLTVLCLLLLISTAYPQEGTIYIWQPVTTNWWNPLNWDLGAVPDSNDTALFSSFNPAIDMCLVDPGRVVRILVTPDGQTTMISGGALPQQLTITDSLRMWGDGFASNLTVFLPDTAFCKITGAGGIVLKDSARLITEGESRWEGGEIKCPDGSGAGWTNRGTLELTPVFFGDLLMNASFRNDSAGVMVKTGSAQAEFTQGTGGSNTFENYGHIDIQEGIILLNTPSDIEGTITIANAGELALENRTMSFINTVIDGPGAVRLLFGSKNYIYGNVSIANLRLESGDITGGGGNLTISDSLTCVSVTPTWSIGNINSLTVETGAILILDDGMPLGGDFGTLNLNGHTVYTANGSIHGGTGSQMVINRGTIDVPDSQPNFINVSGQFINDSTGIINITIPNGASTGIISSFTNYGDIFLNSGKLQIVSSGNFFSGRWFLGDSSHVYIANGNHIWDVYSEIHGSGKIQGEGSSIEFYGKVLPGGNGIGQLTIEPRLSRKLILGTTTILQFQLEGRTAGMEYDQLLVTNNIVMEIDGTLEVQLGGSFTPVLGDTFDIILSDSYTGVFSNTLLPTLPTPGLSLEVIYADSSVRLAVIGVPTGLADKKDEDNIPKHFSLSQNYPNPFNPSTTIQFAVPKASNVKVQLFDILGRRVATLVDQKYEPGTYKISVDAGDLPSGLYVYRLQTDGFAKTRKMVLFK